MVDDLLRVGDGEGIDLNFFDFILIVQSKFFIDVVKTFLLVDVFVSEG